MIVLGRHAVLDFLLVAQQHGRIEYDHVAFLQALLDLRDRLVGHPQRDVAHFETALGRDETAAFIAHVRTAQKSLQWDGQDRFGLAVHENGDHRVHARLQSFQTVVIDRDVGLIHLDVGVEEVGLRRHGRHRLDVRFQTAIGESVDANNRIHAPTLALSSPDARWRC